MGLVVFSSEINAATITVTNTNDSGLGSLRDAVAIAAPLDTIDFALSGCPCTITLTSGEIVIDKELTISGPGRDVLSISGNNASRVFHILLSAAGATVNIRHLTIKDGNEVFFGGSGIYNENSQVNLDSVRIIDNRTRGSGAGIYNGGSMSFTNSVITGNIVTDGRGGGIYCSFGSTLNVGINSAIVGNQAAKSPGFGNTSGGGIFNDGGSIVLDTVYLFNNNASDGAGIYNYAGTLNIFNSTLSTNETYGLNLPDVAAGGGIYNSGIATLNITNSTLSNNSTTGNNVSYGGAIYNAGILNVTNSTLTDNAATNGGNITNTDGGGIYNHDTIGGTAAIKTTIIAGNLAFRGTDVSGIFNSQGYNLIGVEDGSLGFVHPTDLRGSIVSPLDPMLDGLQNNGGPTSTHALLPSSPATDKGAAATDPNGNPITTDQRNSSRPVDDPNILNASGGDGSDIGAFEAAIPPTGLTVSPSPLDFGQVPVNKTKDLVLTVTNNTAAPIELFAFRITQGSPEPFDISNFSGCMSFGTRILDSGEACTQTVRFWSVPGAGGASPATLSLLEGTTFNTLATVELLASVGSPDTGLNSPPTPADDLSAVAPGFAIPLDATRNDSDPDNDRLRITAVSNPPHGTASVVSCTVLFPLNPNSDCIEYTPDSGYEGIDSIVYTVSDGRGGTATATYHLAVGNVVPNITAITPNSGPVSGGQSVRITGSNFLFRSEVAFVCAGNSILPLTVTQLTDNEILATTPPGTPGTCEVRVRTLFARTGVLANAYTYSQPTIDTDGDGVPDGTDNCPLTPNPDQANNDGDAQGDVCDSDDDNDGQSDVNEITCGSNPFSASSRAPDNDSDNLPDCVDPDDDNDGVLDNIDNCQFTANTNQANNDGDAVGDVCDADDDNDGVLDGVDNCQFTANTNQANNDGDAQGDVCDPDDDNDGVLDGVDNCPITANPAQTDTDGDGIGDECDTSPGVFPIVFARFNGIHKINSDGTGLTRLTTVYDAEPALSPDRTRIAFQRAIGEIYLMNASGGNVVRLTNDYAYDLAPDWSPNGVQLVFSSFRYRFNGFRFVGSAELIEMTAVPASPQLRWMDDNFEDLYPAWSPDGSKIAFSSNRFDNNFEIVIFDRNLRTFQRLTNNSATDTNPTWSPDGTRIAWASNRNGNYEIYSTLANGTGGFAQLTNNSADDFEPWWGSDGRIVFTSMRSQNMQQIYIMNSSGGGVTQLTNGARSFYPHW